MEYGAICTPFIFVVYAKSKYLCVLISNEMGKNKLEKFADMASYPHVFEYPYSAVDNVPFDMKGKWHQEFFGMIIRLCSNWAADGVNIPSDWAGCFPIRTL